MAERFVEIYKRRDLKIKAGKSSDSIRRPTTYLLRLKLDNPTISSNHLVRSLRRRRATDL